MSSDTRKKLDSLRERIAKRRRKGQDLTNEVTATIVPDVSEKKSSIDDTTTSDTIKTTLSDDRTAALLPPSNNDVGQEIVNCLCRRGCTFPVTSDTIAKDLSDKATAEQVRTALENLTAQGMITIQNSDSANMEKNCITVLSFHHDKAVCSKSTSSSSSSVKLKQDLKRDQSLSKMSDVREKERKRHHDSKSSSWSTERQRTSSSSRDPSRGDSRKSSKSVKRERRDEDNPTDDLESLLSAKTAKEQDSTRISDEVQELLTAVSTKEQSLAERFRSIGGPQVREFCPHATREECLRHKEFTACKKLHFRKIFKPHTDESLGDCSFLNTCFHMDTCKYVHYEIDYRDTNKNDKKRDRIMREEGGRELTPKLTDELDLKMLPPQWINCDIRYLDFSTLGKFSVIMADPPWDIHMELPYGTMQDQEMRAMRIQDLTDHGLMFLWVTGRAMELGRELFKYWGYKRCDELIWVKTNQLQRLIRTGRTGHWINHGKEHCLIGIKGNPKNINRRLDCDVLVAEVRDTSHKPDEIYGIIERLSPGTRKLELFARMHNIQPNWVSLGNQLDGVNLVEPDVVQRFTKKYPDGIVPKPTKPKQDNK